MMKDTEKEKKEAELQAWLDQVHFGSCCSDTDEDELKPLKKKPSDNGSELNPHK